MLHVCKARLLGPVPVALTLDLGCTLFATAEASPFGAPIAECMAETADLFGC